jgi:hypothetical protein
MRVQEGSQQKNIKKYALRRIHEFFAFDNYSMGYLKAGEDTNLKHFTLSKSISNFRCYFFIMLNFLHNETGIFIKKEALISFFGASKINKNPPLQGVVFLICL